MRLALLPLLAALVVPLWGNGCVDPGKDSHTEAFQTPDEALVVRRGQQHQGWQALAVTLLTAERPGVTAGIQGSDSIHFEADGVSRTISLVPIYETLAAHPVLEHSTIRTYLLEQLRSFDAERLRTLGFEKVKEHLFPMLVNRQQLEVIQKEALDPQHPPAAATLVTNLYRLSVVKWDRFGVIPLSPAMLGGQATQEQMDAAAMQNLRKYFQALPNPRIEVTEYGTMGRSGRLAGQADAAVILLPEFAAAAKEALATTNDLVVLAPMPTEVNFAARNDQKLLESLIPLAKKLASTAQQPLCNQPILLSAEGLSLFNLPPPLLPAATVPASQPDIYIVQ